MSYMQLLCCRNFYKITNLEKKIFYTGFQQATRLLFIGFSSLEVTVGGFCGVADALAASKGGAVTSWYQNPGIR